MLSYVRHLRFFSYAVIFTVLFVALFGEVEVGGMIVVLAGLLIAVDVGAYFATQKAAEHGSRLSNSVIYFLVVIRGSLAALALALVPVIALQFIVNSALSNGGEASALVLASRIEAFHGAYIDVLSSPFATWLVLGAGALVFAAPFLWRSLATRLKHFVVAARLTVFVIFLVGFWGVFSIFSFAVVAEVEQIRFGQIRAIERGSYRLADDAEELWFVSVAQEDSSFVESAGELVSAIVVASTGARISDRYATNFLASQARSAFGNASDLDFGFDVVLEDAVAKIPLSEFSQLDFSTMSVSELVSYRDQVWSQHREVIELKRERNQSIANAISVAFNANGISVPSELGQEFVDLIVESSSDHFARSINRLSRQQIRPIVFSTHLNLLNPEGVDQYPQDVVGHYVTAFKSSNRENFETDMRIYASRQVRLAREQQERFLEELRSRPLPWEDQSSEAKWRRFWKLLARAAT